MPKQGWIDFTNAHRDGHVVVALVLPKGRPVAHRARAESLRATLESLIEKLAPAGVYATTTVPQDGIPEIYCVFEEQADAQRFAEAVRARPRRRDPGWAGQWWFVLDDATLDKH